MWTDRQIIAALNRASAVVERIHDALRPLPTRLTWLLGSTSRTDALDRDTPYAAANTALSHEAIGLWTALGLLTLWAPPWAAVALSAALWCGAWEARQYIAAPRVRTLRDWLLGDGPSYVVGAVAAAVLVGDAVAGRWLEWLALTPLVVLWPGIVGVAFGRVPEK
jgi:hypothetical protein